MPKQETPSFPPSLEFATAPTLPAAPLIQDQATPVVVTTDETLNMIRTMTKQMKRIDDVKDAELRIGHSDLPGGLPDFLDDTPLKYYWVYTKDFSRHRYRDYLIPVTPEQFPMLPKALFNRGGIAIGQGDRDLFCMDKRIYDKIHSNELEPSSARLEGMDKQYRQQVKERLAAGTLRPNESMSGGIYADFKSSEVEVPA